MLNRTLTDRVYESIKRYNTSEINPAVPMSDQFMKDFTSAEGYSESETKHALMVLNESHKVFTITIAKENKQTGSKRLDGYLVADLSVVSNLRSVYQKRLTEVYNKEKNANLGPPQVMREVMSRMNLFVNTTIGRIGNIAIMLNEYENLMTRHPDEFTETWCEEKLDEYLDRGSFGEDEEPEEGDSGVPAEIDAKTPVRAVDTPEYEDYTRDDKSLPPQKMLMIYGADFFFRVKLRKYEFNVLRDLVREGHIKRKADILLLRNMIKTIKGNFDRDPKLNDYFEDIFHLDRELSKRIYFSAK